MIDFSKISSKSLCFIFVTEDYAIFAVFSLWSGGMVLLCLRVKYLDNFQSELFDGVSFANLSFHF